MSSADTRGRSAILVFGSDESVRSVVVRRLVDAGISRERLVEGASGELASEALSASLLFAVGRDAREARRALGALVHEWPVESALPPLRALALEGRQAGEDLLILEGVPAAWLGALVESELDSAETTRALESSRAELDRFLYIISHDLLAPVRSVLGFTSLVQRRAGETLDQRLRELLALTQNAAERLQSMIVGLRDVSRVKTKAGRHELVPLVDLVNMVLADRRMHIEETDTTIEVGELFSVEADATQLTALIDELLLNAIAHSAEAGAPHVSISARVEEGIVEVRMADRGEPLDASLRERVFEPFYRLVPNEDAKHPGTGLTLCRAIARQHGGDLVIEESQEGGNVLVLSLPRAASKAGPVLA